VLSGYFDLPSCFLSRSKKNTNPTQAKKNVTRIVPARIIAALSKPRVAVHFRFSTVDCELHFRREELRVICGTRGNPDTVAPFRAWRGSRDLVAQSPKFHAPTAALFAPLLV
jgi:hypothetical protein